MHVDELIEHHPAPPPFEPELLARAIKACFAAAESSSACADACLSETEVEHLRRCVRLDLISADVASSTGRALARQGTPREATLALVQACARICSQCADECASHDDEHCQRCADACRACEQACTELLAT
jgi:hypothetical protein